jgi:hypothetical protein
MPFTPRVKEEILQAMVGQVVAQSPLTDLSEGSVFLTLLGAMAEGIEDVEFRIKEIRDSYDIDNASGAALDERVADFPGTGLVRIQAIPASGSVLTVTRSPTTGGYTLPAGSLFGRTDAPDLVYVTVSDETFGVGVATVTNVRVVCLKAGVAGNAPTGTINKMISVPGDIVSVQQVTALAGGLEREDDDGLRQRARAYLSGLARCQPAALQALALSFVDSLGMSVRHAHVFEDLTVPAYSELVVDDGTGFTGFVQPGASVTGTIPLNGTLYLSHASPATGPITKIKVGGVVLEYPVAAANPTWISIPERGIIQLKAGQTEISPGDVWVIGDADTPYNVYTGFIQELQALLEGDSSNPTTTPGYRAAGTRVAVLPPTSFPVDLQINVILSTSAVVPDVVAAVKDQVSLYFLSLGPGDTAFVSQLYARLQTSIENLVALQILDALGSPAQDYSAPSPRTSLRAGIITVV